MQNDNFVKIFNNSSPNDKKYLLDKYAPNKIFNDYEYIKIIGLVHRRKYIAYYIALDTKVFILKVEN